MTADPTAAVQAARRALSTAHARWAQTLSEHDRDRLLAAQDAIAQTSMATLGGHGILVFSHLGDHGSPWLGERDWLTLERAGWTVHWRQKNADGSLNYPGSHDSDDPLDAITSTRRPEGICDPGDWFGYAFSAAKAGVSDAKLLAEWEEILGRDHRESGCDCCGEAHQFYWWTPDGRISARQLTAEI